MQPSSPTSLPEVEETDIGSPTALPVANLRAFLDRLEGRRRRIPCTASAYAKVKSALQAGTDESGAVSAKALLRSLKEPLAGVPEAVLRELAEVVPAYERGGTLAVQDLLSAFDVRSRLSCLDWRLVVPGAALVAWIFVAPAVYCPMSHWTFLDAIYFGIMAVSTVGAPDIVLETTELKAVTFVYLFITFWLHMFTVVCIFSFFVDHYEAQVSRTFRSAARPGEGSRRGAAEKPQVAFSLEQLASTARLTHPSRKHVACGETSEPRTRQGSRRLLAEHRLAATLFAVFVLFNILVFIGAVVIFKAIACDDYLDTLYWCMSVVATFGNPSAYLAVGGRESRVVALAYTLSTMPFTILFVTSIAHACLRIHARRAQRLLYAKALPVDLLANLDSTGEGVTKLEFFCAALVMSGRVSESELTEILYDFQKLDPLGFGKVTKRELSLLFGRLSVPEPDRSKLLVQDSDFTSSDLGLSGLPVVSRDLPAERFMVEAETKEAEDAARAWRLLLGDVVVLRSSLDSRDAELVQALAACRSTEQLLQQAMAEKQSLHGEVMLEQHKRTEAEASSQEGRRARDAADKQLRELRLRLKALEDQEQGAMKKVHEIIKDGEKRCREAEQQRQTAQERLRDVEVRLLAAEQRARRAEASAAEAALRALRLRAEGTGARPEATTTPAQPQQPAEGQASMPPYGSPSKPTAAAGSAWPPGPSPHWAAPRDLLAEGPLHQGGGGGRPRSYRGPIAGHAFAQTTPVPSGAAPSPIDRGYRPAMTEPFGGARLAMPA